MRLKNKKTGEIVDFRYLQSDHVASLVLTTYKNNKPEMYSYNSLAELNEEWEDYEEPKEYWYINEFGTPTKADFVGRETLYDKCRKNFGNYFETEEETEKAVEKLKAWKRLKDKGFRFHDWKEGTTYCLEYEWEGVRLHEIEDDLDLLFGGEE